MSLYFLGEITVDIIDVVHIIKSSTMQQLEKLKNDTLSVEDSDELRKKISQVGAVLNNSHLRFSGLPLPITSRRSTSV